MNALAVRLPDFPWDTLAAAKATAQSHPDGVVDLSIGTPVDPTPELAKQALVAAADSPGYPTVWGAPETRTGIIEYLRRRWHAVELSDESVMPAIGTKELVAWLPTLLGLDHSAAVVYPEAAYPTYQVGAITAGCEAIAIDDPAEVPSNTKLIWINSPGNPTGRVLDLSQLREWVAVARSCGAILASDECYGEFAWDAEAISVLDPRANDMSLAGLLAVHSISKRSNAAGYRAGFVAGDPAIVGALIAARKHLGMMMPTPIQASLTALLGDASHVEEQRVRYLNRRAKLKPALEQAGFRIDHSEGSLYLWATRDEPCRVTVDWLAERGILVAPGEFYGAAGGNHVRVALTASDQDIDMAVQRLG